MYSEYNTPKKKYNLKTNKYICNKFGLAEFFATHYAEFGGEKQLRILDAGCGALPLGIYLADQYDCKVLGVELNPIAFKCAIENIDQLNLTHTVEIKNCNFVDFSNQYQGELFDCIVANPPIDENVSNEEIEKYADNTYETFDDGSYSFLTNSWHSLDGKDLVDYIFEFGLKYLKSSGHILLVFCTIDCSSPDFVYKKAENYGYNVSRIIEDYILAKSIGAESLGLDKVYTFMVGFRR